MNKSTLNKKELFKKARELIKEGDLKGAYLITKQILKDGEDPEALAILELIDKTYKSSPQRKNWKIKVILLIIALILMGVLLFILFGSYSEETIKVEPVSWVQGS